MIKIRRRFRGRGGGGGGGGWVRRTFSLPPSGIRPPADPKGTTLYYFEISIFGLLTLKFFLRRLWCQSTSILRGERAPKKRDFLVEIFQKVPKNAFFGLFSNICLRRRKFGQIMVLIVVWESSENQFGRPKKRSKKFSIFFGKSAPFEKFLDDLNLMIWMFFFCSIFVRWITDWIFFACLQVSRWTAALSPTQCLLTLSATTAATPF